jgi:hypothetical protein
MCFSNMRPSVRKESLEQFLGSLLAMVRSRVV